MTKSNLLVYSIGITLLILGGGIFAGWNDGKFFNISPDGISKLLASVIIFSIFYFTADVWEDGILVSKQIANMKEIIVKDISFLSVQGLNSLFFHATNIQADLQKKSKFDKPRILMYFGTISGLLFLTFPFIPSENILTGMTIITFGGTLFSYATKEKQANKLQQLIHDKQLEFYQIKLSNANNLK